MEKSHFQIEINAPAEKVWKVLWEDKYFRDWSSVFAEGSHAVGDWKEGSAIKFIDPKNNAGMSSLIEKLIPNKFMSFKHLYEIIDGKEQPPKKWSGMIENYTLEEENGKTKLTVDLDVPDEMKEMIDKFPQALQRVKELSEAS